MRLIGRLILMFAAALSGGCLVVALQPAYDAESVVFDAALVGAWENADDGIKATIERAEWRSYKVIYTDRFATRTFQSNLTRIGPATFLDLTEMRGIDPGPYLVPVHGVYRIALAGDRLTASPLDYAWFMRAMAQKTPARLGMLSIAIDDRRNVVMTAATSEIRRWLAQVPDSALGAPLTFTRQRSSAGHSH